MRPSKRLPNLGGEILRLVWSRDSPDRDRRALQRRHPFGDLAASRRAPGGGLVSERREGTRRLYQARPEEMRKLSEFLDDFWTTGLERLRDAAEAAQREKEASDGRTRP